VVARRPAGAADGGRARYEGCEVGAVVLQPARLRGVGDGCGGEDADRRPLCIGGNRVGVGVEPRRALGAGGGANRRRGGGERRLRGDIELAAGCDGEAGGQERGGD